MTRAPLLLGLYAACCGCAPPTAVVLDVSVADGAAPASLSLSVYDPFKALVRNEPIARPKLPGRIVLDHLGKAASLRVVVVADGSRKAGATVAVQAGRTTTAPLVLSAATSDRDSDGVPDAVDDCPDVANPDQANARGSGPGDACAAAAGMDLGGADLFGPPRDLALPPLFDLSHVTGLCPIAGATLCEDWTMPVPMNPYWYIETSTAPPQVTIASDGTRPFYGTNSVHMHSDAWGVSTTYVQSDLGYGSNLTAGAFWIRAYLYIPKANPPQESYLLSLFDYGHSYQAWHIAIGDGFIINYSDELAQIYKASAMSFPGDKWFCLEWQIDQVATPGMSSSHIFIDGSEIADLATTNGTANLGDADRLVLSQSYSGSVAQPNGTDLWFNQIAIGPNRIGCIK